MAEKVPKNPRLTNHCHCSWMPSVITYPLLEGPFTRDFASALLSCIDFGKNYPQVICLCSSPIVAQQAVTSLMRIKAESFPSLTLIESGELVLYHAAQAVTFLKAEPFLDLRLKEGVSKNDEITEHVVVGRPRSVLDYANKKPFVLCKVEKIVIVGADEFIGMQGLEDPAIRISNKLHPSCQRVLYTASDSDDVKEFAQKFCHNQDQQVPRPIGSLLDSTQWYYVRCYGEEGKFKAIAELYAALDIGQAIIFCKKSITARSLAIKMSKLGLPVSLVTDDLTAPWVVGALRGFRNGEVRVLISTAPLKDVYLREVTLVMNFDIPLDSNSNFDCGTCLSRVRHARRPDKPGLVVNFVDSQRSLENLRFCQSHFDQEITSLDTEDLTDMQKLQS